MKNIYLLAACLIFIGSISALAGHEEDSWLFNRQGMHKASLGQLSAAIADFEKACRLNPFNDTALSNLACARNNMGVMLANKGELSEAIRQFEAARAQKPEDVSIRLNLLSVLVTMKDASAVEKEARQLIKLRPRDVELALKLSVALQKTENHLAAQTLLEEMLDRVSDDATLHAAMGRLLYRMGNLSESAFHFRRSIDINPDDQDVQKYLTRLERETLVATQAQTYTSVNFTLSCPDVFSEEWAEEMLELLEEASRLVGDRLDFRPAQRAQVLVMLTEDFRHVHDLPDWAGGLYDGKIRLPVPGTMVRASSLRGAVLHEYTHHVVYLKSAGKCPVWLNEGLAQIFENGESRLESMQKLPQTDAAPTYTPTEIDRLFSQKPDRATATILYRQSLAITAGLINEYGWPRISELLEAIATGHHQETAFQQTLAASPDEIAVTNRQQW